jgi:F-actin capping protein, beta subunit
MESLLNKAPPSDLEKNLQWLRTNLCWQQNNNTEKKQLQNDDKYFIPFQVIDKSSQAGERPFLICGYNEVREGLYRSPWTNCIHRLPSKEPVKANEDCEEVVKNDKVRSLEVTFNEVWDAYKNLYYGYEAVGSVYIKDTDDDSSSFEGCFGVKKTCTNIGSSWNCMSNVRATVLNEHEFEYTVDTTVCVIIAPMVALDDNNRHSIFASNNVEMGTKMSNTCTKICTIQPDKVPIHTSHIEHIGTIIEANEIELRSNLERVVIPKHQEIIATIQKKLTRRPQVNPLMGMMMNSDMLKKRLAKSESEG